MKGKLGIGKSNLGTAKFHYSYKFNEKLGLDWQECYEAKLHAISPVVTPETGTVGWSAECTCGWCSDCHTTMEELAVDIMYHLSTELFKYELPKPPWVAFFEKMGM